MSHQTESAPRKRLGGINDAMIGSKVRIAARVLTYDSNTGLAIVFDGRAGILVDTDLCLQERTFDWATERLSTVMVIGHLERSEVVRKDPSQREYVIDRILADSCHRATGSQVSLPAMPPHAPRLEMKQGVILRAILIVHAPDLDLALWNSMAAEEEESL